MKRYINTLTAFILAGLLSVSCSFFDVKPHIIQTEYYYDTPTDVFNAMTGVYGVMSNEAFYGNYYSLMCSNVDDLSFFNRATTTNYTNVYKHDAGTSEIYAAWTQIYKGIRNANMFLDKVPDSGCDQDGHYCNEVRFLRAYYYFILAQAWGDVPLRTEPTQSYEHVACAASSQYSVLKWAADQMEECVEFYKNLYSDDPDRELQDLAAAPSRVCLNTVRGILARVYLFMAGETVTIEDASLKKADFYRKAMEHSGDVISSGRHDLYDDYSHVFKLMMSDKYDHDRHESMWEVEFTGNRSGADNWSNGRIGDLIGLQSSGSSDYSDFLCNFAYGMYDGSLKLWDLYWIIDRVKTEASDANTISDQRQLWNLPPYNYAGSYSYKKTVVQDGISKELTVNIKPSVDTAYYWSTVNDNARVNVAFMPAGRNCGKFRREVEYEGVMDSKRLYTSINFPLLRYSDVLLMYAEASLEYNQAVKGEAMDAVLKVRDRAGIATEDAYDLQAFRQLVRNERARELCFEATRKYDLIRWGIFVEQMNEYRTWTQMRNASGKKRWTSKGDYAMRIGDAVQAKHLVLPVPSVELGVNTELKQNPLW